jgi:hypothetical protein
VYAWTASAGAQAYVSPSGNSNGLALDSQGRLIITQTGLRRVARRESNGSQTSLASAYGGKKLNSPNDVVVKSDGSVWFTDPPLNIPAGQKQELTFSGIFRISTSGALQLLDSSLAQPNGICFSPGEERLYVNNSAERVIYVWDVVQDTLIANRRQFASMNPAGYADGMKWIHWGIFSARDRLASGCSAPAGLSSIRYWSQDRHRTATGGTLTGGRFISRPGTASTGFDSARRRAVGETGDESPGGLRTVPELPESFQSFDDDSF